MNQRIREQCIYNLWQNGAQSLTSFPCDMVCSENPGLCMSNILQRQQTIARNTGLCKSKPGCECIRDNVSKQFEIGERQRQYDMPALKAQVLNSLDVYCPTTPNSQEALGPQVMTEGYFHGNGVSFCAVSLLALAFVWYSRYR